MRSIVILNEREGSLHGRPAWVIELDNWTVKLEFESGRKVNDPSEADLIAGIPFELFSILSQSADSFIQCAHGEDKTGVFSLEYRDPEEGHLTAGNDVPIDQVLNAFVGYLKSDPNWREGLEWCPLELKLGFWQRLFGRRK